MQYTKIAQLACFLRACAFPPKNGVHGIVCKVLPFRETTTLSAETAPYSDVLKLDASVQML
jgi:hypothetical protein